MKMAKSMLPVTLLNEIVLFFITLSLPNRVPTHVNADMKVNGFGSRWIVVIIGAIPVIFAIGLSIYWHVTKDNESTSKNRRAEKILFSIITAFLTVVTWLPVLLASQSNISMGSKIDLPLDFIILFPLGVLMIIIGNFMGIIKYNHWLGIRTPWTLANETVWKKTHRFGGYTGVIGGILMCVFSVLGFIFKAYVLSIVIVGFILGILLVAFVPAVYSYIIYRKERLK